VSGQEGPGDLQRPDDVPPDPDDAVPDQVEEADEESFPASDPPSSWSGGPPDRGPEPAP